MPVGGLYSVPRHHIYGGKMARPSFNSNDFEAASDEPAAVPIAPTDMLDGANDVQPASIGKEKTKNQRAKKKHSLNREQTVHFEHTTEAKADIAGSKAQSKKDREVRRERKSLEKKRKRDSETHVTATSEARKGSPIDNRANDKTVSRSAKISLSSIVTPLRQPTQLPHTSERPSKKTKKKSDKGDQDVKMEGQSEVGGAVKNITPAVSKISKLMKQEKNGVALDQQHALVTSFAEDTSPRKTPVPLPLLPQLSSLRKYSHLQQISAQEPSISAGVLVPETPPSQAAKKVRIVSKAPVPFTLPDLLRDATMTRKPSKDHRRNTLLSTPAASSPIETPKSAPSTSTSTRSPNHVPKLSVSNALTDANLNRHTFTQPLNSHKRVKVRARSASSATTSTSGSTSSSKSVPDMFARIGKPYTTETRVPSKSTVPSETHEEATMVMFNEKLHDFQATVNFSDERAYLQAFLLWGAENDAELPCLGKATGCTTKKEEIIRISKEVNINFLSHIEVEGGDSNAIDDAHRGAQSAEELLMLTIKARIPVPIGSLEGKWTLYCPKYAEKHYDKYGFGQRTLNIYSVSGAKHKKSHTARLNIPPRSMSYSVLAFSTPPHASFRTTTVKTAAEGYNMDIVFLGGGYLHLRVDLNLLLKGKATTEVEGKKMHMEFLGVHEKALQWWDRKDDIEEEGKRLFAKYDGGRRDE